MSDKDNEKPYKKTVGPEKIQGTKDPTLPECPETTNPCLGRKDGEKKEPKVEPAKNWHCNADKNADKKDPCKKQEP